MLVLPVRSQLLLRVCSDAVCIKTWCDIVSKVSGFARLDHCLPYGLFRRLGYTISLVLVVVVQGAVVALLLGLSISR